MTTVSIKEAKNRFTELVRLAEKGETVTITRNGTRVAELTAPKKKKGGIDWEAADRFLAERGVDRLFTYIAPDFDDPLPEDFLITPLPEPQPRKK
ncbi:MAG TPA: type II toxin-antitoxin system prevent-host-death family antitoxin [Rhizomicrobium sp.]|nr:type II toxin-antitoxin system prevent-host-death family antitoxin [Rhizomicrobium sp.]